ncbi:MAG TPA: NrsF family protein [Allosphingosinicella sp.]|nr:NrsF family protein [Allosphingosinicella sp.]
MSDHSTESLIEALAADARPVTPLAPPLRRGLLTLAVLGLAGAALVAVGGDRDGLLARYSGRETLMMLEMAAMLLTALLAVLGAFALSVPGGRRGWMAAPLPAFAAWLSLSGIGCYQDVARLGRAAWGWGHGANCLVFIIAAGLLVGAPLLWRLARARPVEPLPVALLGGLGAAALAALLLQFFHAAAVTVVDLAVHFAAVLLVVGLAALSRRRTLAPA